MGILVLGAGLAGLSCGCELSSDGVEVTVLEKEGHIGGMAASFAQDGYTIDLGPHRFHTMEEELLGHVRSLPGISLEEKVRSSRILLKGRFFDYPLKIGNAFFNMPPTTTARIASDYLMARVSGGGADRNFEEWVVSRFGRTLYELYFKLYTEKTWGIPCTKLSIDWAAQRISLLSLTDTLVKTLGIGKTPRTYVNRFHYPSQDGIGAISEAYGKAIKDAGGTIRTDASVKKLKMDDDAVSEVAYGGGKIKVGEDDTVFATIPITSIISSMDPSPPAEVVAAAGNLRFRSIVFVYLMFDYDRMSPDHWIYLPEPEYTANRVSEPKNFSVKNAPDGKTIVAAELTCQVGDDIWVGDQEELAARVLSDLSSVGLVSEDDFLGSTVKRMEYAYPIYDLEYRGNLDVVTEYLNGIGNLRFFGRNALFRYNNMDHSIKMGLTAAKTVTDDSLDYMRVATDEHWFG